MKLAVVCSKSKLNSLPVLREVLDDLFIESRAWFEGFEVTAAESIESLKACLEYSSYVICIPDLNDFSSTWLHYTLGFQRGCKDKMAFWIPPEEFNLLPEWTAGFTVITGGGTDIFNFYWEREQYWQDETKEVMARRAISDQYLEVSARTFVETVQNGNRFLLGMFLEAGFSPALRDSSAVPVLNQAIRSRHFSFVGPLIEAGADLNGVAEDRGTTPVMDAAAGGSEDLTLQLIEMNAELEHASRDGQTAVTLAVGNGHAAATIILIGNGADIDVKDNLGMSARKYATLYNQAAILEAISTMSV